MEKLERLVSLGCSRRGLAIDIGISPSNVRFYLGLRLVSDGQLNAVARGASVRKALEKARLRRIEADRERELAIERKSFIVSTRLAEEICHFCLLPFEFDQQRFTLGPGNLEQVFYGELLVKRISIKQVFSVHLPPVAPAGTPITAIAASCRPNPSDYLIWFDFWIDWLALTLISAAPKAVIRNAAIKKAESLIKTAMGEMHPVRFRQRVSS